MQRNVNINSHENGSASSLVRVRLPARTFASFALKGFADMTGKRIAIVTDNPRERLLDRSLDS
jgi:hypothetical protein